MLLLNNLSVAYQNEVVVKGVSFELEPGQIGCLLGPSGCGKTSILRAIAGFERVAEGEVVLRHQVVANQYKHLAADKRKVAVVFQDYALFPHFTVSQNIAFGLQHISREEKRIRVEELLRLVGLSECEARYPHSLSGGQQQRVALARALAPRPDLLLLDEPFSSLDAELREDLAKDIRAILKHENTTALMVTHDQHEAFSMADVIGVVHNGQLLQWSTAYALYHRPEDRFVADFIGDGVFMRACVSKPMKLQSSLGELDIDPSLGLKENDQVDFLVRPDDVVHDDDSDTLARVVSRAFRGAHIFYELELQEGKAERVFCLALSHHDHKVDEMIGIRLDLAHLIVFPA